MYVSLRVERKGGQHRPVKHATQRVPDLGLGHDSGGRASSAVHEAQQVLGGAPRTDADETFDEPNDLGHRSRFARGVSERAT